MIIWGEGTSSVEIWKLFMRIKATPYMTSEKVPEIVKKCSAQSNQSTNKTNSKIFCFIEYQIQGLQMQREEFLSENVTIFNF